MGVCQSKKSVPDDESIYDDLERSFHSSSHKGTQRQRLAKHLDDVDIKDAYTIVEVIGEGSMGEVTIVKKKPKQQKSNVPQAAQAPNNPSVVTSGGGSTSDSSERLFACKTVNTTRMKPTELAEFFNEITILRDLDHPNIIQLFEVYKVKRKVWLVMELCMGGDLSTRAGEMTEEGVAIVLEQVLRAVHYMHKRNICHRDIKLENIMYMTKDKEGMSNIKLIDFGLSNKFQKGQKMKAAVGTIYTMAPELISGDGYTEQTDVWSIGVVAFILLSQSYPFMRVMNDLRDDAKVEKLRNATLEFGPSWNERHVSKYGREFCARCLKKSPSTRWWAVEALEFVQNVWFPYLEEVAQKEKKDLKGEHTDANGLGAILEDEANNDATIDSTIGEVETKVGFKRARMNTLTVQGMQKFGFHGELKKTVLMTMAYTMDKSSLTELRDMFYNLDKKSSGTIELTELKQALKEMHSDKHLDDETIEKLFKGIDIDNSGEIHYMEFLAAVAEGQGLVTQERLAETFDRIDTDSKGYISKDDLKEVLGSDYNEDLVNRMIDQADTKKNGQVDYDEFLKLMFDEDPEAGMDGVGSFFMDPKEEQQIPRFSRLGAAGISSPDLSTLENQSK
eukprot:CAMPEP_0172488964 /NCGR_PEP_ID=MMETSP1066-20121228/18693_1 /TAXON_ID=671091 /ORGANISM="Coscinodiscus wailesii, Strain CCMP2513" /LENGTH=617 /DNA_ID=CAMNT_0013256509 /DNA_START=64 /DNA_END=1917 /DNA_ORIENTATION=+